MVSGGSALYHVSGMVYGELLGMMIDELEFAFNVNGRREKMMEVAGAIIEQ